jgi:vacuolar protein sorting-associated protein 11
MWKTVNFFSKIHQEDALNYSCSTVNYFGDSFGVLYNKSTRQSCYGYGAISNQEACNLVYFDKSTKILFTVGNQDQIPTLKIWKSDFKLIRPIKITFNQKIFPVTHLAVYSVTHIAIGLENGVVILMKGDFTKDRTISSKIVYQPDSSNHDYDQTVGLGFRDDGMDVSLYIVTSKQVLFVKTSLVSTTTRVTKPVVLDTINSSVACLTPQDKNQEMAVADDQVI